jgi:F5/8 type C domain
MKPAAVLLSLVWLSACSFPEYDAQQAGENRGGTAATAVPACDDGERNGDETGIDCGMAACSRPCATGQVCSGDADCDGGACQNNICQAPSCTDTLKNADESDTDCGGEQGCTRCGVGKHCSSTSDCDGGQCASGQCRAPTCKDGLTNANETDTDCGGDSCTPCEVGQACSKLEDCDGVACTKGKCQPAACADSVWNQDETDVDCGGSCPNACDDGLRCKLGSDCASSVCPKQTLRCAAPTCSDGVANGDEPSADCGGSCSTKCAVLDACNSGDDCKTTSCSQQFCVPTTATGQVLSPLKWSASASDTFDPKTTAPKLAIDGIAGTNWISGTDQAPGLWFLVDMGATQAFFSLEIDCNDSLDAPVAIDVAFSNDGTFDAKPVKENYATTDRVVITFPVAQVARYIKITLAQGKNRWWRIDEIRVKQ